MVRCQRLSATALSPVTSVCPNCSFYALEPTTGIEPVNLILTKDALYQLSYVGRWILIYWSGKRDSNPRPQAWKARALPLSYSRFTAPETEPLTTALTAPRAVGGERRIRTSEGFAGRFTVCSLWPLGNPTE